VIFTIDPFLCCDGLPQIIQTHDAITDASTKPRSAGFANECTTSIALAARLAQVFDAILDQHSLSTSAFFPAVATSKE
jgi:hypothetical protein